MSDRARILVADDEHNLCRVLVARLSRDGHLADAVHDGAQALERLRHEIYDLVFLDMRMPALSGMDVLTALRCHDQLTAVVVMTAYDGPDTVDAALAAGADAYITKPFDIDWVADSVAEILERRRAAKASATARGEPTPGSGEA